VSIEIRPFDDADADAVVALWRLAGLTRPWNDPYRDIERKKAVQRDLFLVAVERGRALMAEFEARLLALGCPKVNLQVREGNDDVLAFYAELGFTRDPAVSLGKRLIADD
jgi:GNAT superfamily N-acetyltransferase